MGGAATHGDLGFLSRTAIGFMELEPGADIYDYIAGCLAELVPDAYVIVSSFDQSVSAFTVRSVRGISGFQAQLLRFIGRDLVGMVVPIDEATRTALMSGRIERTQGTLLEISHGVLPSQAAAAAIEKLMGVEAVYQMGFVRRMTLFGDAAIVPHGTAELQNRDLIEAFLAQASIALQHRRAEEALRQSEERFRQMFHHAPLGYQALDADGRIVDVNARWLEMLGYQREEVTGRLFDDLLAPASADLFETCFPHLKITGEVHDVEIEMVKKDGARIPVLIDARTSATPRGEFRQAHCILRDITTQRDAARALSESEERYRELVEKVGEGVGIVDPDERFVFANPAAEEIYGVPRGGLVGRSALEFMDRAGREAMRAQTGLRRTGRSSTYEFTITRPDGGRRTLLLTATPRLDRDGRFAGTVGIFRVIAVPPGPEDQAGPKPAD